MNIDWMCLLKAIGTYGLTLLLTFAVGAAIFGVGWLLYKVVGWIFDSFLGGDIAEAIGTVAVIVMVILLVIVFPIYVEYQKTCP